MIKANLNKPTTKAVVLAIFTLATSVLCNCAVSNGALWLWTVFIVVAISNLAVIYLYAKADKNSKKDMDQLKKDVDTQKKELKNSILSLKPYSTSLQGVAEICKFCAQKANVQIHEIIEHSRLDCKTWNFDAASDIVCMTIYNYILQHLNITHTDPDGEFVDVEVEYVKLVESDDQKQEQADKICLCGHYHPTRSGPRILGRKRIISETGYHDSQLFFASADDPDILLDNEAIGKAFTLRDGKTYDYSQYIGIPVLCTTAENTRKMVGLLEIVCHGKSIISSDRQTIESIAKQLLVPYAYMFLLLFKMDKALRAVPK